MKEKIIEVLKSKSVDAEVTRGIAWRSIPDGLFDEVADEILELWDLKNRGWDKLFINNRFAGWFMPAEINWIED